MLLKTLLLFRVLPCLQNHAHLNHTTIQPFPFSPKMERLAMVVITFLFTLLSLSPTQSSNLPNKGLCAKLIQPSGYPCTEHTVQTKDGYLLGMQRVSSCSGRGDLPPGPPVLLVHGILNAGDSWFLNSKEQSLGFILADSGFDVWVGNVRGTDWSPGHVTLSNKDKEFWDWSWQELALHDLPEMINFVYSATSSKVFYVGHSQGTIMALAAFTQPDIVDMVEAAALLSPMSYLGHISSPFALRVVHMHLDQMIMALGIHQLSFRSDFIVHILDAICDAYPDCANLLTSITGKNCCINSSRHHFYFQYEPHPTSARNLHHLFQMIRTGKFSMYDYGLWGNRKHYGHFIPPTFDVAKIPESLPLWMSYGGNDALADVTDVRDMLKDLKPKPELLYIDSYGHLDFIMSTKAKEDVYDHMIRFFCRCGALGKSAAF